MGSWSPSSRVVSGAGPCCEAGRGERGLHVGRMLPSRGHRGQPPCLSGQSHWMACNAGPPSPAPTAPPITPLPQPSRAYVPAAPACLPSKMLHAVPCPLAPCPLRIDPRSEQQLVRSTLNLISNCRSVQPRRGPGPGLGDVLLASPPVRAAHGGEDEDPGRRQQPGLHALCGGDAGPSQPDAGGHKGG